MLFQPHFDPLSDIQTHAGHGPPPAGPPTQSKPIRLALACKQCRKRKVRCDAEQPKCRNCRLRGDQCETSDPRKSDDSPAVRRRATKRWQPKTLQKVTKNLSPACPSPEKYAPGAVNSINSVLNPVGSALDSPVGQASPDVRRISRSSVVPGSTSSAASSSWRTNQSERLGEDHFSWQSRAYQESTAAHVQEVASGHHVTEPNSAGTPMTQPETSNTEVTADKTKVGVDQLPFRSLEPGLIWMTCSTSGRVACIAFSTLSIYIWRDTALPRPPHRSHMACPILRISLYL
jgi:hypothetical protein